jgi:hypothetical protein
MGSLCASGTPRLGCGLRSDKSARRKPRARRRTSKFWLFMLGGNQDDRVSIARYDRSIWRTFVVPDKYDHSVESLPLYTQPAEAAGSEA